MLCEIFMCGRVAARPFETQQGGKRPLPLLFILSGRFPERGSIAGDVEDVIDNLEQEPERLAKLGQGPADRIRRTAEDSPHFDRDRDEQASLQTVDPLQVFEITGFSGVLEIEDLPGNHPEMADRTGKTGDGLGDPGGRHSEIRKLGKKLEG